MQKKKTIFNKNHVLLELYLDEPHNALHIKTSLDSSGEAAKVIDTKETVVRKKSPLGFYYDKIEEEKIWSETTTVLKRRYDFILPDRRYVLSFYESYLGNRVSQDQRPWEIADSKSMEEHYIFDLLADIDAIYQEMSEVRKKDLIDIPRYKDDPYSHKRHSYYRHNDNSFKRNLYKLLFGYETGPKFQTNEEKILSHGFDTKTSFRKM